MVASATDFYIADAPGRSANLLHVPALKRIIPRNRQEFQILLQYYINSISCYYKAQAWSTTTASPAGGF
jgi:hypothetical protein